MEQESLAVADRLNSLLTEAGLQTLDSGCAGRFAQYLALLMRWNARMNLTAIRDEAGILARHFVECIACAQALPPGIASLLDFGSGAGFPGIPVALCRPEIAVTLCESQGKKAAFLQEAVRVLGLSAKVHGKRAETLARQFDCVTLRAVDHMADAVRGAAALVDSRGYLVAMTTHAEFDALRLAAGAGFSWADSVPLHGGENRILCLGARV
jgi:16S rRNA (guanine527-N7)-methyltransferase